jgi:hypothetical protein
MVIGGFLCRATSACAGGDTFLITPMSIEMAWSLRFLYTTA